MCGDPPRVRRGRRHAGADEHVRRQPISAGAARPGRPRRRAEPRGVASRPTLPVPGSSPARWVRSAFASRRTGGCGPRRRSRPTREQAAALAEAGVDLLVIETQTDLRGDGAGGRGRRDVAPDLAVVVTATFTKDDRTLLGSTPEQVAARLVELGADAIGVNCGEGPAQVLRVIRAMRRVAGGVPLVARPNAGGPAQVGGRFVYPATPATSRSTRARCWTRAWRSSADAAAPARAHRGHRRRRIAPARRRARVARPSRARRRADAGRRDAAPRPPSSQAKLAAAIRRRGGDGAATIFDAGEARGRRRDARGGGRRRDRRRGQPDGEDADERLGRVPAHPGARRDRDRPALPDAGPEPPAPAGRPAGRRTRSGSATSSSAWATP